MRTVLPRITVIPRSLVWAVPAQAPEAVCPTLLLPVFAGVWEPEVSQTLHRQSQSALPHQTASGAKPPLRSGSLVIGRLIDGTHNPTHASAVNETANNQGPHSDVRFSVSDTSSAITRPTGRKRVYIYTTRGSG